MNQSPHSPDDLIAQGTSISKLRKHFSSKEETLRFYANTTISHYSEDVPASCCSCNSASDVTAIFTWHAFYNSRFSPKSTDLLLLFLGHIRVSTAAAFMHFSTRHGFCNSCWKAMFLKRCIANVLYFFSLFLGIVSGFTAPVLIATYLYFRSDRARNDGLFEILLMAIGSTLVFALCMGGFFLIQKLRVPAPLRTIPRFPFRYKSVKKEPLRNPPVVTR